MARFLSLSFLLGALCFVVILLRIFRQRTKRIYPPGPKGLPVIGNVLDIRKTVVYLTSLSRLRGRAKTDKKIKTGKYIFNIYTDNLR